MYITNKVAFAETFCNDRDDPIALIAIFDDYDGFPPLRGHDEDNKSEWDFINDAKSDNSSVAILDCVDWQHVNRKPTFAQIAEKAGTNHELPQPVTPIFYWGPRQSFSRPDPTKARELQRNYVDEGGSSWFDQTVGQKKHSNRAKERWVAKRKEATADMLLHHNMRLITKNQEVRMDRYATYDTRYRELQEQSILDKEAFDSKWGFLHSLRLHSSRVIELMSETYCKDMVNQLIDLHPGTGPHRRCKTKREATKLKNELIDAYNSRRNGRGRRDCNWRDYPASDISEILSEYQVAFRTLLQRDILSAEKHAEQLIHAKNKIKEKEPRQVLMLLPKQCFPPGKEASRLAFVRQVIKYFNERDHLAL